MQALVDAGVFLGATAGLLILSVLVGYAPVRAFTRLQSTLAIVAAAPFGVTLIVAISGVTGVYVYGPLGVVVPLECGLLTIAGFVLACFDARRRVGALFVRGDLLAGAAVVAIAVIAVSWQVHGTFGYGPFTAASWNWDIMGYALGAKHLAVLGTGQRGWIVGFDTGGVARLDVLGAYTALTAFSAPFGDALLATMPTIAAVSVSMAMGVFVLARLVIPHSRVAAVAAALMVVVAFPSTYNAFQYFLAEKLAIVAMLVSAASVVSVRRSTAGFFGACAGQAVVSVALITAYPQVVPIMLVTALGLGFASTVKRLKIVSVHSVAALSSVVIGIALAGVILAPYVGERIARARALMTASAGWPMPTYSLVESLGLKDPIAGSLPQPAVIAELAVAVALAFVGAAVWSGSRRTTLFQAIALLVPMVVFARFAMQEPDTYRQWKAMALAAPFATVAVIAIVATFANVSDSRRVASRNGLLVGLCVVALLLTFHWRYDPTQAILTCVDCRLGSALRSEMAEYERTAGDAPVAIARGPGGATMVAAYFLWGKRPLVLRDPTNWGSSGEPAIKTLGPNGWY